MKTITQITEEKQDKVLQSPMLAQVIMKLKNAFAEEILAYYQYTILEYFVNTVSIDKKVENLFKDIIKDFNRTLIRYTLEDAKEELEDHAYWILGRLRDLGSDWSSIANPILLNQVAEHKYIEPSDVNPMVAVSQVAEAELGAIETYKDLIEFTKECDPITNKKMKEILKDEEKHLKEMEEFKTKYEELFKDPVETDKK